MSPLPVSAAKSGREEVSIGLAPGGRGRAQRQILRRIGDEIIRLAEGVVAVTGPSPVGGGPHQASPDGIQVAISHHGELMMTVLDAGRAQTLHHDLSTATGP